ARQPNGLADATALHGSSTTSSPTDTASPTVHASPTDIAHGDVSVGTSAAEHVHAAEATDSPALSTAPGLADRSAHAPLADLFAKTSPSSDPAWQSEQFSERANQQLQLLAKHCEQPAQLVTNDLTALVAESYHSAELRVPTTEVFRDGVLAVSRQQAPAAGSVTGRDSLREQLQRLLSIYAPTANHTVHLKFKIVRTTLADEGATTTAYVETSGPSVDHPQRTAQQTAKWDCHWQRPAAGDEPLLREITVSELEEVTPISERSGTFLDCTESLFANCSSYSQQLVYGADHWYGNMDVAFGIHHGNQGLAIGDANGDGRDDLFLCQPAGLPCRLYIQQADGTLFDATRESGLDWLDASRGALFADFDNDGDQDLAVSLNYSIVIFENLGTGRFFKRTRVDVYSWPTSLAAADYDNDGDLDLYICGYNPRGVTAAGDIFANPVPYHDANNGAPNFMMRNEGEWNFTDVTQAVGLDENNHRFSFAATWEDYDNDGDQDLYVANDFGRNSLYRNDRDAAGVSHFHDVAAAAGVEDIAAGMSVSWGDYNHDGWMDLYVSNMFSSAGNRIVSQSQFKPSADDSVRSAMQRHARGNSLFENQGDGTFRDVSLDAHVTLGRWAWGSLFADLNNDGWDDLYVANGFFTTPDTGDL
ncbi:MAG: VCBS repeat-containing protein, partial [Planctomycetales bacterium]|nr:VCBS repeat-containing protein [Planctomycetales bacterium]